MIFDWKIRYQDHTTLCRVRNEIVAKKAYKRLLKKINKELETHQVIVKTEVIVDTRITVMPLLSRELLPT
ncbi:MAG: hypothetical protein ACMUEL_06865 [Flavobacteriales bacterium Tduv]